MASSRLAEDREADGWGRADPGSAGWRNVEDGELATLAWVDWFNNQRLHGHLEDRPPAEFEAAYIANTTGPELVGTH